MTINKKEATLASGLFFSTFSFESQLLRGERAVERRMVLEVLHIATGERSAGGGSQE